MAGDDGLPLTEDRIREIFRARAETGPRGEAMRAIAALQMGMLEGGTDPASIARLQKEARETMARARAGMAQSLFSLDGVAGWMKSFAAALKTDWVSAMMDTGKVHGRIGGIARLIALLGYDEARAQATSISERAVREHEDLAKRPWKYSAWDHELLFHTAAFGWATPPYLPEEVDAVMRVRAEILQLDPMLAVSLRRAELTGEALRADPEAKVRRAASRPRDVEARKWLSRKRKRAVLSANRFGDSPTGLAFVDELYAAGATKVSIAGETVDDEEDGSQHAAALRVRLPNEADARRAVFAITNREARREGFDEEEDTGQDEVYLWWD